MCYRHIKLIVPTWQTYISGDDPERPVENAVFRSLREREKAEMQLWYTLQSHYMLANIIGGAKNAQTYFFMNEVLWEMQL